MAKSELSCAYCGTSKKFANADAVISERWAIIAWDVNEAEPRVVCQKCPAPEWSRRMNVLTPRNEPIENEKKRVSKRNKRNSEKTEAT